MPAARVATRDQIVSRVHTQVQKEAAALAGKGEVLSKVEQEKMKDWTILRDTASAIRRETGKAPRVDAWVDAAMKKVTDAVDGVDKPGKGTISLAEARNAVASKGDAGARIGKAFEILTGQKLEAQGKVKPELTAAISALVSSQKFALLDNVKDGQPITAWANDQIEKALEKHTDSGPSLVGRMKVGDQNVIVATASKWGSKKITETVAFFDTEGRMAGRAVIERDEKTFALAMRGMNADGTLGDVIARAPSQAPAPSDPAWVAALKAEVERLSGDGEDLGVRIKDSELPPDLRAMYEFLNRNTPDGTGLEKITFQGKEAYAFHDYSCVSSVQVYSPSGEMLHHAVD